MSERSIRILDHLWSMVMAIIFTGSAIRWLRMDQPLADWAAAIAIVATLAAVAHVVLSRIKEAS